MNQNSHNQSKRIKDSFNKYLIKFKIWEYVPYMMSFAIGFFIVQKLVTIDEVTKAKKTWGSKDIIKFAVSSIILTLLPLIPYERYSYLIATITGTATIVCIILLEVVFGVKQCFVTLYIIIIFFRTIYYRTVFDNFSMCMAYTIDVGAITRDAFQWYISSNILVWFYFFVALIFLNLYHRLILRSWEHVELLLIMKELISSEKIQSESLVQAHYSDDIMEKIKTITSTPNLDKSFVTFGASSNKAFLEPVDHPDTDELLQAAVEKGIILNYSDSKFTSENLGNLSSVEKRNSVVIAIRIEKADVSDCAMVVEREHNLHSLIDHFSSKFKITPIRKFGNVWIGTLGFFKSYDNDATNCHRALIFSCSIDQMSKKLGSRVAIALDYGNIVAGFVNSPHFDIFGPEIRFVLRMADLHDYSKIIVSESIKQKLVQYKKENIASRAAQFEKRPLEYPWKKDFIVTINTISNVTDLIDANDINNYLQTFKIEHQGPFYESLKGGYWKITFEPQYGNNRKNLELNKHDDSDDGSGYLAFSSFFSSTKPNINTSQQSNQSLLSTHPLHKINENNFWAEDLHSDFKKSIEELHGINLDHDIIQKYSEEEIEETHQMIQNNIYDIIHQVCFPFSLRALITISKYKKIFADETQSLDQVIPDESRDYHNPLVLFLSKDWMIGWLKDILPKETFGYLSRTLDKLYDLVTNSQSKYSQNPKIVVTDDKIPPLHSTSSANNIFSNNDDSKPFSFQNIEEKQTIYDAEQVHHEIDPQNQEENLNIFSVDPKEKDFFDRLHSDAIRKIDTSPQPIINELKNKMSWDSYSNDMKLYFHHNLPNFLIEKLMLMICWYIIIAGALEGKLSRSSSIFVNLLLLHAIISQTVERLYSGIASIILTILHIFIIFYFPYELIQTSIKPLFGASTFGDFGGDVAFCILITFRVPSYFNQPAYITIIENIFFRAAIFVRIYAGNLDLNYSARTNVLILTILLSCFFYIYNYHTFVSYIIEHRLVPFAKREYQSQCKNTENLLEKFNPSAPKRPEILKNYFKWYSNCYIIAVHIKAIDLVSGLIDARDLAKLADSIGSRIDLAFKEFGLLKVTSFSGVHVAIGTRSIGKENSDKTLYTTHYIVLLRSIQNRIEKFGRDYNFNVSLGLSLSQGSAYVGFLGNLHYCFDIGGRVRDMTVAMATFNNEGIFMSRDFEYGISKVIPSNDLVDKQKIVDDFKNPTYWLRIDGTVKGMQLEDFSYIGMLGKGGYGSVHLVREKLTNTNYAVKAIPLKGSVMSQMIRRECIILQKMQHPNVVGLKYSFNSNNRLYLVMSYIQGGNLRQLIDRDKFDVSQLRIWFAELVLAIEYVHSMGIIHRDIKPGNCMIDTDGHLKLADFGLSKIVQPMRETQNKSANTTQTTDSLSVSSEVMQKLRKFLPLKSHFASSLTKPISTPAKSNITSITGENNPIISILVLRGSEDEFNTSEIKFNSAKYDHFTVEITLCFSQAQAEASFEKRDFDSIFIESDYQEPKSKTEAEVVTEKENAQLPYLPIAKLVQYFYITFQNAVPIYVVGIEDKVKSVFLDNGARECFPTNKRFDDINEETLIRIFSIQGVEVVNEHSNSETSANQGGKLRFNIDNSGKAKEPRAENGEPASALTKSIGGAHIVGTMHFIAPEVIAHKRYDRGVDWWAAGVTFYFCATRQQPFKGDDKDVVFDAILRSPLDTKPLLRTSPAFIKLMEGLLNKDDSKRLGTQSVAAIKNHEFFFNHLNWSTISTSELSYRPTQFLPKKFDIRDKLLFYGDNESKEKKSTVSLTSQLKVMELKNKQSLHKYQMTRSRVRSSKKPQRQNGSLSIDHIKQCISGEISLPENSKKRASKSFSGYYDNDFSDNMSIMELDENEEEEPPESINKNDDRSMSILIIDKPEPVAEELEGDNRENSFDNDEQPDESPKQKSEENAPANNDQVQDFNEDKDIKNEINEKSSPNQRRKYHEYELPKMNPLPAGGEMEGFL